MKQVFGVFSQGHVSDGGDEVLVQELEGLHRREWSADWHAYRAALADLALYGTPRWMPEPEEGLPGWTYPADISHARIIVKPVSVLI